MTSRLVPIVASPYLFTERTVCWESRHAQYLWDTIHRLGFSRFHTTMAGRLRALTDKGEAMSTAFEGASIRVERPPGELVVGVEVWNRRDGFPICLCLRSGYVGSVITGTKRNLHHMGKLSLGRSGKPGDPAQFCIA